MFNATQEFNQKSSDHVKIVIKIDRIIPIASNADITFEYYKYATQTTGNLYTYRISESTTYTDIASTSLIFGIENMCPNGDVGCTQFPASISGFRFESNITLSVACSSSNQTSLICTSFAPFNASDNWWIILIIVIIVLLIIAGIILLVLWKKGIIFKKTTIQI